MIPAFKTGWIEPEAVFLDMLQARNTLSHLYHKKESEALWLDIKNVYFGEIKKVLDLLKGKMH